MSTYHSTKTDRLVTCVERPDRLTTFRQFVGPSQRQALYAAMQGEEGVFFRDKVKHLIAQLQTMPTTYQQDGLGEQAIVYLHYFTGGADWYITEQDMDTDGEGQHQAFGLADLYGDGGELGYISLVELLETGAELDLYWTPKTLQAIREGAQ